MAVFLASCGTIHFSCYYPVCRCSIPDRRKNRQSMVLSIYDNTQISSVETNLPWFRLGIFAWAADQTDGGCNCRVRGVGCFWGYSTGKLLGDRLQRDRFFWEMAIANTVNSTV